MSFININTSLPLCTAVGRRKKSIAKVKLETGSGSILVNQKPVETYFQYNSEFIQLIKAPLLSLNLENSYDISIEAKGGGLNGQTDAVKLGIARALCLISDEKRPVLKKEGYLTRDYRSKERKKYGLRKARKAPQFSKR
jgi:small subunit ribosomal protein S9